MLPVMRLKSLFNALIYNIAFSSSKNMLKLENTKEKALPTELRVKNTNFYQYLK